MLAGLLQRLSRRRLLALECPPACGPADLDVVEPTRCLEPLDGRLLRVVEILDVHDLGLLVVVDVSAQQELLGQGEQKCRSFLILPLASLIRALLVDLKVGPHFVLSKKHKES